MKFRSLMILAPFALMACSQPGSDYIAQPAEIAPPVTATDAASMELVSGLSARILQEGDGAPAESGQIAVVNYTGWLHDPTAENNRGDKFDSSVDRDEYFPFMLGAGRVIKGWDQGVVGMKVGEKRELTIAPEMAYGDRGAGGVIPPGATLVFEVELIELQATE